MSECDYGLWVLDRVGGSRFLFLFFILIIIIIYIQISLMGTCWSWRWSGAWQLGMVFGGLPPI